MLGGGGGQEAAMHSVASWARRPILGAVAAALLAACGAQATAPAATAPAPGSAAAPAAKPAAAAAPSAPASAAARGEAPAAPVTQAAPAEARPLKRATLQRVTPQVTDASEMTAIEKGFFREAGFEVELVGM